MRKKLPRINEIIVVEGKDDIAAVKRAVDAEVISTHGFGFGKRLLKQLQEISKRKEIIIFTDADYMGKKIRRDLSKALPQAKHAYLSREQSLKQDNVGVENASPEDILQALIHARMTLCEKKEEFTLEDLRKAGLINGKDSSFKRCAVCDILRIGHGNGKQMLHKLNGYGITRKEFEEAVKKVEQDRTTI